MQGARTISLQYARADKVRDVFLSTGATLQKVENASEEEWLLAASLAGLPDPPDEEVRRIVRTSFREDARTGGDPFFGFPQEVQL